MHHENASNLMSKSGKTFKECSFNLYHRNLQIAQTKTLTCLTKLFITCLATLCYFWTELWKYTCPAITSIKLKELTFIENNSLNRFTQQQTLCPQNRTHRDVYRRYKYTPHGISPKPIQIVVRTRLFCQSTILYTFFGTTQEM